MMDGYQSETKREPQGGSSLILLAVCGLGLSSVITQLALMREMLGAFSGNEMVLGIILGNWLLLTGIGAWLGRTTNRRRNPRLLLVLLLLLVALMPLAQMFLLRALRNVVFVRGALVGVTDGAGVLGRWPHNRTSNWVVLRSTLVATMASRLKPSRTA